MSNAPSTAAEPIEGDLTLPKQWTVFAPVGANAPLLSKDLLKTLPETITVENLTLKPEHVTPTRNQYDFQPYFGEAPYDGTQGAYVFLPLQSKADQDVTLGFGADWFVQVWLNGEVILDTTEEGNGTSPPSINDHRVTVDLKAGENMLVVRFVTGVATALLAIGGPAELRSGDFKTIRPDLLKVSGKDLSKKYPPDPEAPIQWRPPEGFDPDVDGLGLPQLEAVEHIELMHCHKGNAPFDEGGTGKYESLLEGTWNHNIRHAVFQDRFIAIWDNHAQDENGPGSRVLARAGKVLNDEGEIDWGTEDDILEIAPPPVPVRRRKLHSDEDAIRDAQATAQFYTIDGRMFLCGRIQALHGVATGLLPGQRNVPWGETLPSGTYHFAKAAGAAGATYVVFDLGVRFFQEWGIKDDRLQPISPLYKENELPTERPVTPELTLPLEPFVEPYVSAPLLAEAPADFQQLVLHGERDDTSRTPKRFKPGTTHLAADDRNGIVPGHGTEFRRPDGSWVAVMENKDRVAGPYYYYGAERPNDEAYYPPARRTSLYGGVKPSAGELPDQRPFIVVNSPNRRNMYLTLSKDGRVFDKTWLLRFERLANYTPGAMKGEGGPGSGPQYFKTAVLGQSVWIVYSISKEHIAVTRVPVGALD